MQATITWEVVEYDQGYVLHVAGGNAAPCASGSDVALVQTYPGQIWNIVPIEGNIYA